MQIDYKLHLHQTNKSGLALKKIKYTTLSDKYYKYHIVVIDAKNKWKINA